MEAVAQLVLIALAEDLLDQRSRHHVCQRQFLMLCQVHLLPHLGDVVLVHQLSVELMELDTVNLLDKLAGGFVRIDIADVDEGVSAVLKEGELAQYSGLGGGRVEGVGGRTRDV